MLYCLNSVVGNITIRIFLIRIIPYLSILLHAIAQSVGIVRLRTQAMEFSFSLVACHIKQSMYITVFLFGL
jgi:hypothetical protein